MSAKKLTPAQLEKECRKLAKKAAKDGKYLVAYTFDQCADSLSYLLEDEDAEKQTLKQFLLDSFEQGFIISDEMVNFAYEEALELI